MTTLLSIAAITLDEAKASGGDLIRIADGKPPTLAYASTFDVLQGLVNAVDTKDRYTRRHSEDVARYADILARELGLDHEMRTALHAAGLLHYEEVFNQSRMEVLDAIARADHVEHDPLPGQAQGLEGLKQRVNIIKTAFNPQFTLEHVIAEGDKVAVMWSNRGTHLVEWFGVPPTGKTVVARGIDIHLIRDGRMAEHWDVVDMLSILMQIGALPAPRAVTA